MISNSQRGLVQITPNQLSFLLLRDFSKTSETGQCGTLESEKRNVSSASSRQTIAFSADLVQLRVFTGVGDAGRRFPSADRTLWRDFAENQWERCGNRKG